MFNMNTFVSAIARKKTSAVRVKTTCLQELPKVKSPSFGITRHHS